jgi:hypothetical protein
LIWRVSSGSDGCIALECSTAHPKRDRDPRIVLQQKICS